MSLKLSNPLSAKGLIRIPSNDAVQYTGKRLLTRVSDLAGIETNHRQDPRKFPTGKQRVKNTLNRQLELLEISRELRDPCGLKRDPPRHRAAM